MRLRSLSLVFLSILFLLSTQAQPLSKKSKAKSDPVTDKNFVPLPQIVEKVKLVLDSLNTVLDKDSDPKLLEADFDFQTVTTGDTTVGFSASVLTIQAEHKKIATRDTLFTYTIPEKDKSKSNIEGVTRKKFSDLISPTDCTKDVVSIFMCLWNKFNETTNPQEVEETLTGAIVSAAKTARTVPRLNNLTDEKFTVTLSFQVDNSFNAGADSTKILSIGPQAKFNGEIDRTQSVKLVFQQPPPK